MKLKKSIALLIPLLLFSLFAYADIDSAPDYILVTIFFTISLFISLLIFILGFIKRYVGKDHRANKWIYISSFTSSCILIYMIDIALANNGVSKFFILLLFGLFFFISTCAITFKKSITKSDK